MGETERSDRGSISPRRGVKRRWTATVVAAAFGLALALPAAGEAAVGDLTFSSCFADAGASGCTVTTDMNQMGGVAVSPDGRSVYTAAIGDAAVTHFSLGPTGTPSLVGCVTDGGSLPCTNTVPGEAPLNGSTGVAVSGDGTSVYVASPVASTVSWLDRVAGGGITFDSCFEENDALDSGCPLMPSSNPMMEGAVGVAVRPGGSHVLLAAEETDSLVHFPRGGGGLLSLPGCFINGAAPPACTTPAKTALDGATGVAISPDGADAYVAANVDDAVSHFHFTAVPPPLLTFVDCYGDPAEGCVNPPTLGGATGIAVSPDGTSVYVASNGSASITHMARAPNGSLSFVGCIRNGGFGCVDPPIDSLTQARGVVVSPDGRSVYVASHGNGTVTEFERASDGSLTFSGCIADLGALGCVDPPTDSLGGAHSVAVSPDGASVYVGSEFDSSLTHLTREVPPPAPAPGTAPGTTPPVAKAPAKCKKKKKKRGKQRAAVTKKKKKKCTKKRKKRK